tara:strand:+ start:43 stop:297 length:255 start_codon:yes stop_codon:yes gene_type:complete
MIVDSGKGWSEEIYCQYSGYDDFGRTQNRKQRSKNFAKCLALLASFNLKELDEAMSEAKLMRMAKLNKILEEQYNGTISRTKVN